jgi:hypothetical protein
MSIDGFAIGRCSIRQGEESSDAAIPRGAPISGATSHCPETGATAREGLRRSRALSIIVASIGSDAT